MIYPSKLGIGLGALAATLYLVSLQTQSGLLFLVLGILFGCGIINAVAAIRTTSRLRVAPPARITAVESEPVREPWAVHNPARHRSGTAQVHGPWGVLLRSGSLAPGETAHLTPELVLARRGVYPLSRLDLVSSYPFGLVRCRRRLAAAGEIVVHPATYACLAPLAAGFQPVVGGKFTGRNRTSSGDSFHGVRPIQPQDPEKLIHWPSSAKGLGVMVKEFDEEISGRVAVLLVPGPGDDARAGEHLDWAARAAASLMYAALDEGHQVEFAAGATGLCLSVPPFSDGLDVLDALARLHPGGCRGSASELQDAVQRLPRKAGLAFVLTGLAPEVPPYLCELRSQGRRCALYLPETTGGGNLPTGVPVFRYGPNRMDVA